MKQGPGTMRLLSQLGSLTFVFETVVLRGVFVAIGKNVRAVFRANDKYERGNEARLLQNDETLRCSTRRPKNERF